jgi:hypothetical protein
MFGYLQKTVPITACAEGTWRVEFLYKKENVSSTCLTACSKRNLRLAMVLLQAVYVRKLLSFSLD